MKNPSFDAMPFTRCFSLFTSFLALLIIAAGPASGQNLAPYFFFTLAGKAGNTGTNNLVGPDARFNGPYGIAADGSGNAYIADTGNHIIRKVLPNATVITLAGLPGVSGHNDGTTNVASFNYPTGIAIDLSGNLYIADWGNHTLRKITPDGQVTTLAGFAGTAGSMDGTNNLALSGSPCGSRRDNSGNIYVADEWNHTIRLVSPSGVVTTIAGTAGNPGVADGIGTNAQFNFPTGSCTGQQRHSFLCGRYRQ